MTSLLAADCRSMPLAGVSCLLVDDSDEAESDPAALERAGATTERARTVCEGLHALARSSWNLLVAAPGLPDGSGYQVVAYAAVTRLDVAILIVSDAERRLSGREPFESAFTFLERQHTGERLVRCAETALARAGRSEFRWSPRGEVHPSDKHLAVGFSSHYDLSRRQRQVLTMLVAGSSPKHIAERLAVSPVTVRRHAEGVYRKCGVRCQRELLALVARSMVTAPLG